MRRHKVMQRERERERDSAKEGGRGAGQRTGGFRYQRTMLVPGLLKEQVKKPRNRGRERRKRTQTGELRS